MDLGLVSALVIFFLLTPHIPDVVLYKVDHGVIRAILILLVLGSLWVGPLESIMMLLAVGSLFLERNTRKFRRSLEAGESDIPASFIESTMSPDRRVPTAGARISRHSYVEEPSGCDMESPIADTSSAVGEKPLHDTAEGDSQGLSALEEIAKSFTD
jgi:hypothetical protein